MRTVGWFLLVVVIAVVAAGGGYAWFVFSGRFDIAATEPHWPGVRRAINAVVDASVEHHAEGLEAPSITEDRVAAGALAYSESCATCHGAPGIDRLDWAKGMLPVPPHLSREAEDYTVAQIFWIVDKGIKMSGMPAWQDVMSEEEMWNVAALAKRLPELSASEYQQMLAAAARAEAAAAAGGAAGGGAAAGGEGDGGSAGNGGSGGDAAASASETGATSDKEASAGQ